MRLTLNSQEVNIQSVADAQTHWEAVRSQQFSEVWLDTEDEEEPALAMLVNGQRAWLMYLRNRNGDPGSSSRDPAYAGPPGVLMEFRLINGQEDQYPAAWTLPLLDAITACEYFIASGGMRPPHITWHEDSDYA